MQRNAGLHRRRQLNFPAGDRTLNMLIAPLTHMLHNRITLIDSEGLIVVHRVKQFWLYINWGVDAAVHY